MDLNAEYWDERYVEKTWGWDIGYASPALVEYATLHDTDEAIFIPGCGHAYEAEALWKKGFRNITLMDFSPTAKSNFLQRVPDFPEEQFKVGDFFEHEGSYDLILEQTFFCALDPSLRDRYASKMHELLHPKGRLAGVLFNFPLTEKGPPFGGSEEEYRERFEPHFEIVNIQMCYNSIEPRQGNELFFELKKPA